MTGNINDLSRYSQYDTEKLDLIKEVLREFKPIDMVKCYCREISFDEDAILESSMDMDIDDDKVPM